MTQLKSKSSAHKNEQEFDIVGLPSQNAGRRSGGQAAGAVGPGDSISGLPNAISLTAASAAHFPFLLQHIPVYSFTNTDIVRRSVARMDIP